MNAQEIVCHLQSRGLLDARSFLDSGTTLTKMPRRNENWNVAFEDGGGFFVKCGTSGSGYGSLRREANTYRAFQSNESALGRFKTFAAPYHDFDDDLGILTVGLVSPSTDLRVHYTKQGRLSRVIGAELGRLLHTLHAFQSGAKQGDDEWSGTPWILSAHRPSLEEVSAISHAQILVVKILQSSEIICGTLDELAAGWRPDALIHGDIKADNILLFQDPPGSRKTQLKLVDFELSSLGDPMWDAGSVFGDYLSFWLTSSDIYSDEDPETFIDRSLFPLETIKPAVRAFWNVYRASSKVGTVQPDLKRATLYAGARVLQTAIEQIQFASKPTSKCVYMLQLAENIFHSPEAASNTLLGLRG